MKSISYVLSVGVRIPTPPASTFPFVFVIGKQLGRQTDIRRFAFSVTATFALLPTSIRQKLYGYPQTDRQWPRVVVQFDHSFQDVSVALIRWIAGTDAFPAHHRRYPGNRTAKLLSLKGVGLDNHILAYRELVYVSFIHFGLNVSSRGIREAE